MELANEIPVNQSAVKSGKVPLVHLAAYAGFLLKNKLEELVRKNIHVNKDADFHLMKFYDFMTEEKMIEVGTERETSFLTAAIEGKLDEQIAIGLQRWKADLIPLISRTEILAEDITLLSYLRKKVLLSFLHAYTNDVNLTLAVVQDIDEYIKSREAASFKTYTEIQKEELDLMNSTLRRSQEQLLEAQELTGMGSFDWDLTGKNSTYSPQLLKILGIKGSISIADFLNDVHVDDREKLTGAIDQAVKANGVCECEYRYCKDGKERVIWFRAVVTIVNGAAQRLKGTILDITEKLRTAERLKETEDRYYKMVDEVKDYAILWLNRRGDIENWNQGAKNIKGYEAAEIIGKNFSVFYSKEDQQQGLPTELLETAVREGQAKHEGWRVRKDGTKFWGNMVITALHRGDEVIGFSKVTRDLTEKKAAEDNLRKYAHRLESKNKELELINKELESFSYIASHDLQEPLRNIKIFTARIAEKEGDALSDKGKLLFSKINMATGRMQKLIDDLLAFSRTQAFSEDFVPVDLNQTLNEIKSTYSESIQEQKLKLDVAEMPVVKGIAFQFYQLFDNIITNSIKYSRTDVVPEIKISWLTVQGDAIEGADTDRQYYKISVADNGIGFEPKYAQRIFEIFQRLHGRDEYSGTGIGLAICKRIVQNHEGFIYAEGVPGTGATFYICLPV